MGGGDGGHPCAVDLNAVAESVTKPYRRPGLLDPELEPTDRLLDIWSKDRWDSGVGGSSLHPLEVMRLLHDGETLGGTLSNDDVMIIVDQAVLKSPQRIRLLTTVWYKTYAPVETKAKRLGISRSALYVEWRMSLSYHRATLRAKGVAV